MTKIAVVFVMGGLLLGASRCSKDDDTGDTGSTGGVSEDGGTGTAGSSGGEQDGSARCGDKTCSAGMVCCNASCGICTAPGGFCTQQACDSGGSTGGAAGGDDPPPTSDAPRCGGIAARECPGLGQCVDDPTDSCNPRRGGADCGGVCECTGRAKCGAGQKFDSSPQVCTCVGGDDAGSSGGGDGVTCGSVTCAAGDECCNASCGICVPPGGACTTQLCPPDDPGDPDPTDSPFCGGFAGLPCPGAGECVDDPSDDCDPNNGGADCGGICKCMSGATVLCAQGTEWNADPNVCACVPPGGGSGGTLGEKCGMNTCPADQTCCNASCGICAPPGGGCIQIACL